MSPKNEDLERNHTWDSKKKDTYLIKIQISFKLLWWKTPTFFQTITLISVHKQHVIVSVLRFILSLLELQLQLHQGQCKYTRPVQRKPIQDYNSSHTAFQKMLFCITLYECNTHLKQQLYDSASVHLKCFEVPGEGFGLQKHLHCPLVVS